MTIIINHTDKYSFLIIENLLIYYWLHKNTRAFISEKKGDLIMDRKAFIGKLTAQLKQWDGEIEKLEAKVEKAGSEAKAGYNRQIQELRSKKAAAQEKLEKIKRASEEAWERMKSGVEEAFDDVKNAFKSALSKFK
jgi:chromosome segregation ATPase